MTQLEFSLKSICHDTSRAKEGIKTPTSRDRRRRSDVLCVSLMTVVEVTEVLYGSTPVERGFVGRYNRGVEGEIRGVSLHSPGEWTGSHPGRRH